MSQKPMFKWSDDFLTNLKEVDEQHLYLVELINSLSEKVFDEKITFSQLKVIVEKLFEYTKFHFGYEEELMQEKQLSAEFVENHEKNHHLFIQEISNIYNDLRDDGKIFQRAKLLLNFLINWLAFHILEQDKIMAKQIELINKGKEAEFAYEEIKSQKNAQSAPLVEALKGILDALAQRNHDLIEFKKLLEDRVNERTKELMDANESLKKLSPTDKLTKIYNRRYAMQALEELLKEAFIYDRTVACIVIDIDSFEELRKNYDDEIINELLIKIARVLSDSLRTDDIVARLGSGEFMVLCPDTKSEGAIYVANNILRKINNIKIRLNKDEKTYYEPKVSIGIAFSNEQTKNIYDILKIADDCVSKAQNAGGNCIKA